MAIQKTPAIVLKTQPFRSTSLIVTFFTKSFGKIRGLAKGVRQEREMRGATFELFTHIEIVYYEKMRSDLHLISEESIIESHDALQGRLDSIVYASYFAELVDVLCEIHDPHEKIFDLLDFAFRYLPSLPGQRLPRLFEIKLLNEIGWLPYLNACINCNKELEKGFFSARQGALVCPDCKPQIPDALPLQQEALSIMRYYIKHDLDASIKMAMTRQTEIEIEGLINRFLLDRLGKPLKSKQFLHKVQAALK
jgi:DNA repair protein RecO (recombination protein O)